MDKTITPMLIGKEREPFDSDEYLFELKMDGIRCLAFIENNKVDLRNKRNIKLLPKFPDDYYAMAEPPKTVFRATHNPLTRARQSVTESHINVY